jgi:hypothetical protein
MRSLFVVLVFVLPLAADDSPWDFSRRVDDIEKKQKEFDRKLTDLNSKVDATMVLIDQIKAKFAEPMKVASPTETEIIPVPKTTLPPGVGGGWVPMSDGTYERTIKVKYNPVMPTSVMIYGTPVVEPAVPVYAQSTPVYTQPYVGTYQTIGGYTVSPSWYGSVGADGGGTCVGGDCGNTTINYGRPGLFGRYRR